MYTWLKSYIQKKADMADLLNSNTQEESPQSKGEIIMPFELVFKVDRVNVFPAKTEGKKSEEEKVVGEEKEEVEIPEMCGDCYHLDEENGVCKANMDFKMVNETGDCSLFYDKEKLGGMSFGANKKDKEEIRKQLEKLDEKEVMRVVSEVMEEVDRTNRGERSGSLIVKKSRDEKIDAHDAVDLFMVAAYKGIEDVNEDNWSNWCDVYQLGAKVKEDGKKEIKKRKKEDGLKKFLEDNKKDKSGKKSDKKEDKKKKNDKLDEKETKRREKEMDKFQKVIKRSMTEKESNRFFKRLCGGKEWGDVIDIPAYIRK